MLYTSRPFRARLRGLFLIPWPEHAAAVGQCCSLRAQTSILTTTMLRAGALVLPPFLEMYSHGCASRAALCTLREWECGYQQDLAFWSTSVATEDAGKHQDAGWCGFEQSQLCRAHLGPWVAEMGTPGQCRILRRAGCHV